MARDFRPKAARQSNSNVQKKEDSKKTTEKGETSVSKESKNTKSKTKLDQSKEEEESESNSENENDEDDDADDETLLREIKALGGDEEDLKLIKSTNGKEKEKDDREIDPALNNELLSFMQSLDYKGAGVAAPTIDSIESSLTAKDVKGDIDNALEDRKQKEENKRREREEKRKQKERKAEEKKLQETKGNVREEKQSRVDNEESRSTEVQIEEVLPSKSRQGFVMIPTPHWNEVEMPELPSTSSSSKNVGNLSNNAIVQLQYIAENMLSTERTMYRDLTNSGKTGGGGPGLLSSSDARFISELLAPGSRGGTLSDRIAALTLLAQTSPLHNVEAMDMLLTMASKKGREESGKATRALADWLAADDGLPNRKLRYFRDQPLLEQMAELQNDTSLRGKSRHSLDMHLVFSAFEDKLKRFYFEFLKLLETQSHDTLPFVRKQAVTHIYVLLKEKPEQEQNLLRLLVNKLGDSDRSVASKASSHILSLLNSHPAMKAVVTNEVSNLVMQAPSAFKSANGKDATTNSHAQYFGVLTLNQTMLSADDEKVANRLVELYFELFEGLLQNMSHKEPEAKETQEADKSNTEKRDKGRWRDRKGFQKRMPKKKKNKDPESENDTIQDANAKIVAAILAGIRRALPFAKIDGSIIEKHMDMLFRITHVSTFNISIQALQLIHQVCLTGHGKDSLDSLASTKLQDRFFRALYTSLFDPRLTKTSKQAMYLNLLFKSMKYDLDDARTKAFVKRFTQLLNHSEPPFICGSLYLLGQLFVAKPGLKSMLNDAEDEDDDEHFVDADEEVEGVTGDDAGDNSKVSITSNNRLSGKLNADNSYDGMKRDPKYAHANVSCLWELISLLSHFHPSVQLCANQLLTSQRINTTADLTLHTLSHFLDRFVYRNPKVNVTTSKGASLMQPALHANGLEAGVIRLRGQGIQKDEFVNDEAFWRKSSKDIPADQLFFHKYFNLRQGATKDGKESEEDSDSEDDDDDDDDEVEEIDDEDVENLSEEEDSEMEREIWKEMRRTIPREEGDDVLDESDADQDDDDADLIKALNEAQSSDDEDLVGLHGSADEDEEEDEEEDDEDEDEDENGLAEDEDDLLPFEFGSDDEEDGESDINEVSKTDRKRKADDADEDKPKSKSQIQREQRKKRKAMPTFATAEDYAHLLGNSDDDGDE